MQCVTKTIKKHCFWFQVYSTKRQKAIDKMIKPEKWQNTQKKENLLWKQPKYKEKLIKNKERKDGFKKYKKYIKDAQNLCIK